MKQMREKIGRKFQIIFNYFRKKFESENFKRKNFDRSKDKQKG